ncbi:MAG TPA: penicillin-binding protein activator LpoB [Planctomycetota bacterium]|nr:penicillin-binding protein activator LpoB [Planctomycetota bacterium]
MKLTLPIFAVLPLLALAACSSVKYDDPDKVETLTIDFGSTDLQSMASDMVTSLNGAPQLAYLDNPSKGTDKRIIMLMGGVNNRTSEHIDTEGITDGIRSALLQGGRFRFVAGEQGQGEIGDQVRFQQGSGRVDPTQARAFGKQLGAEVILTGNLRSIEKTKGRSLESGLQKKEDVWYQFTLECVNVETGEIIWSNIKEIRKGEKRSVFG